MTINFIVSACIKITIRELIMCPYNEPFDKDIKYMIIRLLSS